MSLDTPSAKAGRQCDPIERPVLGWLEEPSFPIHRGIVLVTDRLPAPHPTQEVCLHGQGAGGREHSDDTNSENLEGCNCRKCQKYNAKVSLEVK